MNTKRQQHALMLYGLAKMGASKSLLRWWRSPDNGSIEIAWDTCTYLEWLAWIVCKVFDPEIIINQVWRWVWFPVWKYHFARSSHSFQARVYARMLKKLERIMLDPNAVHILDEYVLAEWLDTIAMTVSYTGCDLFRTAFAAQAVYARLMTKPLMVILESAEAVPVKRQLGAVQSDAHDAIRLMPRRSDFARFAPDLQAQ